MEKKLIPGKRYWFRNGNCIYSGLFGGEINEQKCAVLHRRNGDEWAIPLEHVYATAKEAQSNMRYCIKVD